MPSHAGKFLVARSILQDANFRQTVVLLLQHGAEGAFGLVVNRPIKIDGLPFPVFAGGPCTSGGLLMLHGQADWSEASSSAPPKEVAPGVFLGDASCLSRIDPEATGAQPRYRMFSGYAGWGPGQLESELAAGALGNCAGHGPAPLRCSCRRAVVPPGPVFDPGAESQLSPTR